MRNHLATGWRSAGRTLIFCLTLMTLALAQIGPGQAETKAPPRTATLTIQRDLICTYPNFVDHQISTDTVSFTLPDVDGPVSGQGQYSHQGTGYSLAGISAGAGEVRGDTELVLTYGQWNYNGEWMNAEAPGVPSKAQPVTLPLEPGAQVTVSFQNAMAHEGVSCSGTVIYQIDFKRETQVWQVDLTGERRKLTRSMYFLVEPSDNSFADFIYEHGVTFTYELGARVTLEKRAGKWQYKSGQITRAKASHVYQQNPEMYKVISQSCPGCTQVAALAGQALSGFTDGTDLILHWPYLAPVVTVRSVFSRQCAPGPRKNFCESKKKEGSGYTAQDELFFQLARGHVLILKERQMKPLEQKTDTAAVLSTVRHEYWITRVQ